jgi:hypothetical protein
MSVNIKGLHCMCLFKLYCTCSTLSSVSTEIMCASAPSACLVHMPRIQSIFAECQMETESLPLGILNFRRVAKHCKYYNKVLRLRVLQQTYWWRPKLHPGNWGNLPRAGPWRWVLQNRRGWGIPGKWMSWHWSVKVGRSSGDYGLAGAQVTC